MDETGPKRTGASEDRSARDRALQRMSWALGAIAVIACVALFLSLYCMAKERNTGLREGFIYDACFAFAVASCVVAVACWSGVLAISLVRRRRG